MENMLNTVTSNDLSITGLFEQSDFLMKLVMVALIGASVWSWAIIFDKWLNLKSLKAKVKRFEERFWSGGSLDELYDKISIRPDDPMSVIFVSAMKELRKTNFFSGDEKSNVQGVSLQQRIERAMQIALDREIESIETHMTFLASVGSTAPFVGLFGTIWGIINSFQAIGATQNTSLAVIAPGMAEALFTTALGLIAAIPAVLGYNKLSTDIDRFSRTLENFSGEFSSILSRHIDETSSKQNKQNKE
ncbi:MAG: protein TolQ [Alphaproteobacteria bacterium]